MKILLGVGACTVLIGAAMCATAAPASACPYGTVPSAFSGVCVSGGTDGDKAVPDTPAETMFGGQPGGLPSVDGIPCTPQQLGTCIGLSESQR